MRLTGFIVAALALAFVPLAAPAQSLPGKAPAATPGPARRSPWGADRPQGLATGLINALAEADDALVERFLARDSARGPSGQPPVAGSDLAAQFAAVLNAEGSVASPASLTADPAGTLNDGLAADLERIGDDRGTWRGRSGHRAPRRARGGARSGWCPTRRCRRSRGSSRRWDARGTAGR